MTGIYFLRSSKLPHRSAHSESSFHGSGSLRATSKIDVWQTAENHEEKIYVVEIIIRIFLRNNTILFHSVCIQMAFHQCASPCEFLERLYQSIPVVL